MLRNLVVVSLVMSLVTTTASCTTQEPKQQLDVYFTSIALVSPQDVVDAVEMDSIGDRAQEGAGKGMAAGTLGGAAAGAVFCGPYLYGLCVTALMAAGIMAGGVTGALYGFSGFPKAAATELQEDVEDLSRKSDLPSTLVALVREQVAPEMLADAERAEIQAVLTITSIEFIKKSDSVYLVSNVRASFQSTESRRVPEFGYRDFAGQSEKFSLGEWMDSDTGTLEQAIQQSLVSVADEIVQVLNERWRP